MLATDPETLHVRAATIAELCSSACALIAANADEVVEAYRGRPIAPDWARYLQIEQAGALVVRAAYVDGQMVGYCVAFLADHLHYQLRYALVDSLFVAAEHRDAGVCSELMRAMREHCRAIGIERLVWAAPPGSRMETVMRQHRFAALETTYYEDLG